MAAIAILCAGTAMFCTWRRAIFKKANQGGGGDGWLFTTVIAGIGLIISLGYSVGQGAEDLAHVITHYNQDDHPEVRRAAVVSESSHLGAQVYNSMTESFEVEPITEEAVEVYTKATEEPDY